MNTYDYTLQAEENRYLDQLDEGVDQEGVKPTGTGFTITQNGVTRGIERAKNRQCRANRGAAGKWNRMMWNRANADLANRKFENIFDAPSAEVQS